jgi:hypothetical protein
MEISDTIIDKMLFELHFYAYVTMSGKMIMWIINWEECGRNKLWNIKEIVSVLFVRD